MRLSYAENGDFESTAETMVFCDAEPVPESGLPSIFFKSLFSCKSSATVDEANDESELKII